MAGIKKPRLSPAAASVFAVTLTEDALGLTFRGWHGAFQGKVTEMMLRRAYLPFTQNEEEWCESTATSSVWVGILLPTPTLLFNHGKIQ